MEPHIVVTTRIIMSEASLVEHLQITINPYNFRPMWSAPYTTKLMSIRFMGQLEAVKKASFQMGPSYDKPQIQRV